MSFGLSEEEVCSNHNNIYIINGRSKNRAKICTVVEVGVDLLPAKHAETGFGTALGRDKKFLLFEVTVGVLLLLVAVVAFAFKGQYVLAASEVPVDVSAFKRYWYFC